MGISASEDVFYRTDSGNAINLDTSEVFPNALTMPSRNNNVERSDMGGKTRKSSKRNRNRYNSDDYNNGDANWQDDGNW